eukprot:3315078-Amphidinium_carterae.2
MNVLARRKAWRLLETTLLCLTWIPRLWNQCASVFDTCKAESVACISRWSSQVGHFGCNKCEMLRSTEGTRNMQYTCPHVYVRTVLAG